MSNCGVVGVGGSNKYGEYGVPDKTIECSQGEKESNMRKIMDGLIEGLGLRPEQAAGFCGNIEAESHFNTQAVNPVSHAYGICQWLGSRVKELYDFAKTKGKSISDIDLQIGNMVRELKGSYYNTRVMKRMRGEVVTKNIDGNVMNPNTVEGATYIVLRYYEVPGRTNAEADAVAKRDNPKRTQYAKGVLARWGR